MESGHTEFRGAVYLLFSCVAHYHQGFDESAAAKASSGFATLLAGIFALLTVFYAPRLAVAWYLFSCTLCGDVVYRSPRNRF